MAKVKELITGVADRTKAIIVKLQGFETLTGEQKKERLDDYITDYIEEIIDNIGLNIVFKFVIRKVLIKNIPTITQCIFDLIKTKVDGITEVWTDDKSK